MSSQIGTEGVSSKQRLFMQLNLRVVLHVLRNASDSYMHTLSTDNSHGTVLCKHTQASLFTTVRICA